MQVDGQCTGGIVATTGVFPTPGANVAAVPGAGGTLPATCTVTLDGWTSEYFWGHCYFTVNVPTLSQWGALALGTIFVVSGVVFVRKANKK